MKKFAIYLPQFHEIPENNKWWGTGFTEWTNVKNAVPLFEGHNQPKVPYNNYYYNLLDKETIEWQTNLLEKYRIEGFAYYHYYFNGKKLLEKPAENLLKWTDINQRFFFIWANHPWIRSWEGKKTVLMQMEYGSQDSWESHFQYLLKFFKDIRYEKKDNMPLFSIFNSNFPEKNDMIHYFNKRCMEEGFNGLYLIEEFGSGSRRKKYPNDFYDFINSISPYTRAIQIRQPVFCEYELGNWIVRIARSLYRKYRRSTNSIFKSPVILDGNSLIDRFMKTKIPKTTQVQIPTVFFEWDNTPRHNERGYIIKPIDKNHFIKYMDSIKDCEYVFFNAWNEWAEGMIMEPTEENGYKYLEWIREWSDRNEGL